MIVVDVSFDPHESTRAYMGGTGRILRAIDLGRKNTHGLKDKRAFNIAAWHRDVQSCGAEIAVAKFVDRYWGDSPTPDYDGDVGSTGDRIGVRWRSNPEWDLNLRRNDPDDIPFVLVVGTIPTYTLIGWMRAGDGKQGQWWQPNGIGGNRREPCWLIPQGELHPMNELIGLSADRAEALATRGQPEPFAWRFRGGRAIQLHVYQRLSDEDFDLGPSPIDTPPTWNPLVELVDLEELRP